MTRLGAPNQCCPAGPPPRPGREEETATTFDSGSGTHDGDRGGLDAGFIKTFKGAGARSELQAARGAFGNGLHTAVVQEAATVEDHSGDTGFFGGQQADGPLQKRRDVSASTVRPFSTVEAAAMVPSEVVDDLASMCLLLRNTARRGRVAHRGCDAEDRDGDGRDCAFGA